MVENPVLFITFARPEYARISWDAIKAAKPKNLYFYSNKGRKEKEGEVERNNEIRSYVKEIDWECNLHTWFRDESVDVYTSLHGAISWLFENEEQGIILEEDCVASLAFFDYCDQLLPRYKDDYRIWMISGDNYFEDMKLSEYDYFFSQNMQIYGWASWRSRWISVNWDKGLNIEKAITNNVIDSTYRTPNLRKAYRISLRKEKEFIAKTKCWDYTFTFSGILNNSLAVVPMFNLVENIGLDGIHNKQEARNVWNAAVNYKNQKYIINSVPPFITPNIVFDEYSLRRLPLSSLILSYRVQNKIERIVGKMSFLNPQK